MGVVHRNCPVTECVVDGKNRIVSCPAYMFDARVRDVAAGIRKLVAAVMSMVEEGSGTGAAR
jgi:enhancing lycopene biosynthesis protein 2